MPREIKFRAKRVDGGEWVYGYYFTAPLTIENFGAGHLPTPDGLKVYCISDESGVVYAVDPKTVGQYTGLKDKNDKEIYEDDIYNRNDGKGNFCVYYNHGKFVLVRYGKKGMTPKPLGSQFNLENGEVVGNIYKNPELTQ